MDEKIEITKEIPKKIAIYGKAGIGKSITSAHLSVALSKMGEKVIPVGCDPPRDSVALLCGGIMPTILEQLKMVDAETEEPVEMTEEILDKVMFKGYNDIVCCESGGPRPGIGCAGRGVLVAIQLLEEFNVLKRFDITFAIYDVLGDIVCGGFSQPMRGGHAKEVYIVTCGEPLTLYITNEILKAVDRIIGEGIEVGVAGLIDNQRNVPHEKEIVEEFSRKVGVPVIEHIPRSLKVQEAESLGKTVLEAFPESDQSEVYRRLAKKVLENKYIHIPSPLSGMDEIMDTVKMYIKK
ncbi:MAG: nitrogenase iron protein [Candidatus Cloacimonadota bacterium]|nr:MAG: nitrogenase iron protein [Candidatus Cloacimonadota bacterium]